MRGTRYPSATAIRTQISQMGANGRKWAQITVFVIPNTTSCHSEHREESRGVKGRDSSLRSE